MRSLEARLRKLEAQMPRGALSRRWFWIFGLDAGDVERRRAEGLASGQQQFGAGEHIIWRGLEPVPAARWARMPDLTPEEAEDLFATVGSERGWPSYDRGDPALYGPLSGVRSALRAEVAALNQRSSRT